MPPGWCCGTCSVGPRRYRRGVPGNGGIADNEALFDEGLFAGQVEERAEQRLSASAPLAVRMRPATLAEVVGQDHLLAPGSPLRRLVEGGSAASVILYGPPGTGKTTLARLVSQATGRRFEAMSALSAGVKEVRAVIDAARRRLGREGGDATVLFIDEVHRFSRTQQDALLGAVEDRVILLVAATTENPFFSVVSPLLSRSLVLQLHPLSDDDVQTLIRRALADPRGLDGSITLASAAEEHLVRLAAGDARRALTALETAAEAVTSAGGSEVDLACVESVVDRAAVRYDRDGDQHYDVISAFIKSIRGSDVDAALADVRAGATGAVPAHLRDGHYAGSARLGHAQGYRYPHDSPDGVLAQQYPPDALVERNYYEPRPHGAERGLSERMTRLRRIIRGR